MEEKQEAKSVEKVEKKVADKKETTEVKKETKKQEEAKTTKKKFETPKGENKKIDNKMMIGIAVAVIVIIAILVGVLLMKDSPKKAVETMLKDLKSGNYNQEILSDLLEEENFDKETQKLFFDKLEWKIQNVKEEGEKATVELEITNKDFKTIISNYMQKLLKVTFSGQALDENEITNYLIEELKNDEIQTETVNQSIIVEKKDGKWQITEENNDLTNILLPGFNEAISAFK